MPGPIWRRAAVMRGPNEVGAPRSPLRNPASGRVWFTDEIEAWFQFLREAQDIGNSMETTMHGREFEPGITGRGDPQNRGDTPQNEARRQAGTPTTREGSIDKAIDSGQHTGNRPQAQPYAIRHLATRYSVSAGIAAVIAAELGMGGP